MSHILLLAEQLHQKLLIDNYSGGSSAGDKALGDDAFQADIRFVQGKNISGQAYSFCFHLSVWRILGSITQVCTIQIPSLYFSWFNIFQGHSESPVIDYYKPAAADR